MAVGGMVLCAVARATAHNTIPASGRAPSPRPLPSSDFTRLAQASPSPTASGPHNCPKPEPAVAQLYARNVDRVGAERALIEAVRLRLDNLTRHGCGPHLGSAMLADHVRLVAPPSEFPLYVEAFDDQTTLVGYPHERDSWIALYRWKDEKVRTLIGVHGTTNPKAELPDAMLDQLLPLDYTVFEPNGATLPLLVVFNTHPWVASCWRSLRVRVLAPSGDPFQATSLLDETLSGRWCETPRITQSGNTVHVDYLGWTGPWSQERNGWRPRRKSYEYDATKLSERFGFAPAEDNDGSSVFLNLVEDWLETPWSLAAEATSPTLRSTLAPIHEQLRAQLPLTDQADAAFTYTSELFPLTPTARRVVLYCTVLPVRATPVQLGQRRLRFAWNEPGTSGS